MRELMDHCLYFLINKERMQCKLRLLYRRIEHLLTQFIANATFFILKDIIANDLTEILKCFNLTVRDLFSEGVIQFWEMFLFYLMQRYCIIALFPCQFLIAVISRNSSREGLCLTGLHANNLLIHPGE